MKILYVIAASQDFDRANHKGLWERLSELENSDVVIANIPADYVVSVLKHRISRIREAKSAPRQISNTMKVVRPQMIIRPEIAPKMCNRILARFFWKSINAAYPLDNYDEIRLIIYNAYWAPILKTTLWNVKMAYYLFDEVRKNGNDNSVNKKRAKEDQIACELSDCIFAMSSDIAEARIEYKDKMFVLGNGANIPKVFLEQTISNAVAFVGNFRDWIDKELLKGIIENNRDLDFYIIGPIENNMKTYCDEIISSNTNVFYCGCKSKEDIGTMYSRFKCVIIPYQQTSFIKATRPIKIVESVLAGVPVVTVPVSGYEPCKFIYFATDVESFSNSIRRCCKYSIDRSSSEYLRFVAQNTWQAKAAIIANAFNWEEKA